MDAATAADRQTLLAQGRVVLDALVRDLRAIEGELDALATERRRHGLLLKVCGSLEELAGIGGAELFWGDGARASVGAQHIQRVRGDVERFNTGVSEIEDRRLASIERIRQQQNNIDVLEDALFEAQEEEERRAQEWIIEREISELPARKAVMPWARAGEEDKRFRKSLAVALAVCAFFALLVPYIDLPSYAVSEAMTEPERMVSLMMQPRRQPRPPVPARTETPPPPREQLAEQKPLPEHPTMPDQQAPEKATTEAPSKTAQTGILAFREKLSSLRQSNVSPRLGLQARINTADDNTAGRTERSMLTKLGPGSSGGINLAGLSRNVGGGGGGGQMQGVQVTRVASGIGGSGPAGGDRPMGGGPGLGRTDEEIQIVFDRYKAALYRLYNRELRKDPALRGQMVLRLTIEPNGSVSFCQLQSSDMNAPDLGAQVVERVRSFDFGAKDVTTITILYPIDFLPAA